MKFAAAALVASLLPAAAFGASLKVKVPKGPVKTDSYIVTLKSGVNKAAHLSALRNIAARDTTSASQVTHEYDLIHGYTALLKGSALSHVLASNDVAFVEADGIASVQIQKPRDGAKGNVVSEMVEFAATQPTASQKLGQGVVVYSVDSGVYIQHSSFGGRASWGTTFGGYADEDGLGHGTHTAAIAVGTKYGLATKATVVAVRVLSDQGAGTYSDIISGINWAYSQYKAKNQSAIVNLSLGGYQNTALDTAVSNAITGGLHFTVAAGNEDDDAQYYSPADVQAANTIGAVDGKNQPTDFSNYGADVDVWAPGYEITSAWIGNPTATMVLSGTSMAAPYAAGVLAIALAEYGQVTPAVMTKNLKSHAKAVVKAAESPSTNLKAAVW